MISLAMTRLMLLRLAACCVSDRFWGPVDSASRRLTPPALCDPARQPRPRPLIALRRLPGPDHRGEPGGDRQQRRVVPAPPHQLHADRQPLGSARQRQHHDGVARQAERGGVGERGRSSPRAQAASAASARCRARSVSRVTSATSAGLWRAICARCASSASVAETSRCRMAAARSLAVANTSLSTGVSSREPSGGREAIAAPLDCWISARPARCSGSGERGWPGRSGA
jgi:hypothetical protein